MPPRLLVSNCIARADGFGPRVDLDGDRGKLLVLTLCIDHVLEREGLMVSVWGSSDAGQRSSKPLLTVPRKYYCGVYSLLLNLAKCPGVRYLQAEWKVNRWGKGDPIPFFRFSIFTEPSGARVGAAVAGSGRKRLTDDSWEIANAPLDFANSQ